MSALTRLALALNDFSERWIPSALAISCILTFVAIGMAFALTDAGPLKILNSWGGGVWVLLEFAMQMTLIMISGSLLAESPALRRGLDALAGVPRTPRGAVVWLAFLSMALCWVHWGLGLIGSAFLARRIALRQPRVHYPLLVAVAYWGMGASWHGGLSGSATLLMATPKHFMESTVGLIPLSQTTFSSLNLALVAVSFVMAVALAWALYPDASHARPVDAEALKSFQDLPKVQASQARTLSAIVERSWACNGALGLLGLGWLALDYSANGFTLTFNKINLFFISIAFLSYPNPGALAAASERAAGYAHGIILQYPLYAGVFGLIKGCGLDVKLGQFFVSLGGAEGFPLVVYTYSAILNYFIPSGGSKWTVEAPYLLEAAKTLDVKFSTVVLAYAWGDMLTDLIQPFFCLPLLAIAKVEFREILGYEMIALVAWAALGVVAFGFLA